MCIEGFARYGGPQMEVNGLVWVWWGSWDWSGWPEVGVKGQGILWVPRMGIEGLVWVWTALVESGVLEMGVKGCRCMWRAWDGYWGHRMCRNGMGWVWMAYGGRKGTGTDLERRLGWVKRVWSGWRRAWDWCGPSIPTLDLLVHFQYLFTHLRPFISIPAHSNTSDALDTQRSLQYPFQDLHAHLKPHTPISGLPQLTKALHTHIRSSIPILSSHTIL